MEELKIKPLEFKEFLKMNKWLLIIVLSIIFILIAILSYYNGKEILQELENAKRMLLDPYIGIIVWPLMLAIILGMLSDY